MKDINEIKEYVSLLTDNLTGMFYFQNVGLSSIRLTFLKYITDNYIGAETKKDMIAYANVQKMFSNYDENSSLEAIKSVLEIVDRSYKLNGLIASSVDCYASELFGYNLGWKKKDVTLDDFKKVVNFLGQYDFAEEEELSFKIGKEIVSVLTNMLQINSNGNVKMAIGISKEHIGKIANKILKVDDKDVYLDFTSGTGSSTLNTVGENKAKIINYEINNELSQISAMLYIMNGYNNFEIHCEDSLGENLDAFADKIFTDPPISVKIPTIRDGVQINMDSNLIAIEQTINCLKDSGVAVLTMPSSVLFGSSKTNLEVKERLIKNKLLQSVISLPISYYGTRVTINLLVISKKQNDSVLFINGMNKQFESFTYKDNKKELYLTEEGINKISELVNGNTEIVEFSKFVDIETIMDNKYDLMPTSYIKEKIEIEDITIEEVDSQLKELYNKLFRSLN